MEKQYRVLDASRDPEAVVKALQEIEATEEQVLAFDIETDGVVEKTCNVIGFSVSWKDNQGIYFVLRSWNTETKTLDPILPPHDELDLIEWICTILQKKNLVMHNGVFDTNVFFHRYGYDLSQALTADTILMKHTIAEERPFGLKEIANLYKEHIGFSEEEAANQEQLELAENIQSRGGKWTQKQKDIFMGDPLIIGRYACADTDLTLKLFWYFHHRLEDEGLDEFFYDQEVMPLYRKATIPMKRNGMLVDVKYFEELEKELEDDILKLTGEIFTVIEKEAEPYVQRILDEKVKETRTGKFAERVLQHYTIPIPSNKKTGKPTLAKSELRSLLTAYPGHPALQWLLYEPPFTVETYTVEVEQEDGTKVTKSRNRKVFSELPPDAPSIPEDVKYAVKKAIFVEAKPDLPYVFNLGSNDDLSWLLFEHYGVEPRSHSRDTGKAKVDKNSLESYSDLPFIKNLLRLKKNNKLLSTYIKPILFTNVDGWVFPPMKQFGTIAGRYSCGSDTESSDTIAKEVNLQTLPRFERPTKCPNDKCKEPKRARIWNSSLAYITIECSSCGLNQIMMDHAMVKRGFIAPKGMKIVNADFSALEPRIFSWVSGDDGLMQVWRNGLDLYSQVSIDVFGLAGVSANEKDQNYLKKVQPEFRQKAKVFVLAVPYGANAARISQEMKIDYEEAQDIINRYLDAYPDLRRYMMSQEIAAQNNGIVKTEFGRIRHMPKAKEMWQRYGKKILRKKVMEELLGEEFGRKTYYEFRNYLNNAKNFPIQATAAHVCNAAIILLADLFVEHKICGWICLQVHDEITCLTHEDDAQLASELMKYAMENNWVAKIIAEQVPILAEPMIATDLASAK